MPQRYGSVNQKLQGMREAARKLLLAKEENLSVFPLYDGEIIATGLTKREYFAAEALKGLLSNPNVVGVPEKMSDGVLVIESGLEALAVGLANDIIAELNKPVE